MPIGCSCELPGHFRDLSDRQPFKAFFVAEQDRDRLLSKMITAAEILARAGNDWTSVDQELAVLLDLPRFQLGSHVSDIQSALWRVYGVLWWQHTRFLYHCAACGRLWVQDHYGTIRSFLPEDADIPPVLLDSMMGNRGRKTTLRGIWRNGRGTLAWTRGWWIGPYEEEATDWDDLESRFQRHRADLARGNQLEDAILERDGDVVEVWRPEA